MHSMRKADQVLFQKEIGARFGFVPYRGGAPALAKDRLAALHDIPTVDEAGLPGFYAPYWYGLWAPPHTPNNIIAQLSAAVVNALADAGVRARLADLSEEIFPRDQQTPEALRALQTAESEKWWPIIKAAGIKAE